MHLDSIAVEYNQEVQAGQVIGTLGRSGTQSSGPHLHLEFRLGTGRVDPAPPLAAALVNQFAR
jgi:murein DD-endopeptidase MepM/ murein hydrolase activator NlpD